MSADFKQSSNLVGAILASGQVAAANTDTTALIVAANSAVNILTAVVHNASGAAINVEISVVPFGQSLTPARRVCLISALAAGDSTSVFELVGSYLAAGDAISLKASAATAANFLVTGLVAS